jgi:hypothetical protein
MQREEKQSAVSYQQSARKKKGNNRNTKLAWLKAES